MEYTKISDEYYDYKTYEAFRNHRNMIDADVARLVGISACIFSKWKCGKSTPKFSNLKKIALAVGTTPEKFKGIKKVEPVSKTVSVPNVNSVTKKLIKKSYVLNSLQKVKILAVKNDLTMSEFSELVDIPMEEILTWDKTDPTISSVLKVAKTFDCSLGELLHDKYDITKFDK